jgi:hypothetical protein
MHGQYVGLNDSSSEDAGRRETLGALAHAAFDSANSGNSDLTKLATGLARAGNGRHVMIWSAQPDMEALWSRAGGAGQLGSQDLMTTVLNFGTNKLDWFLDVGDTLDVTPGNGQTELTLHIHLKNRTPPGQSTYIAGPGRPIDLSTAPQTVQPYGQYTGMVAVNLPAAATGAVIDGNPNPPVNGPEGPTTVLAVRVMLQAGQAQDVTVHFGMPGDHGQIRVQPSARVPTVSWGGIQSFNETGVHTVSW